MEGVLQRLYEITRITTPTSTPKMMPAMAPPANGAAALFSSGVTLPGGAGALVVLGVGAEEVVGGTVVSITAHWLCFESSGLQYCVALGQQSHESHLLAKPTFVQQHVASGSQDFDLSHSTGLGGGVGGGGGAEVEGGEGGGGGVGVGGGGGNAVVAGGEGGLSTQ